MNKEKIVLGLDIGVGSIGWGLVKIKEEEYCDEKADGTIDKKHRIIDGEILDTGIRAFQVPQDRQKKSLALQRGNARRSRKTTRRKAQRLKNLIKLAKEINLIDDNFDRDAFFKPNKGDNEKNWDIWTIRKEALERTLTNIELFRVLYHIAKHRGFFFHTKAKEIQEEDEKTEEEREKARVKKGLRRIQNLLKEGRYKTVGQMFYEKFKQTNPDKKRKRNAPDKYENSIHRNLLKKEIEIIFEEQKELRNTKANEELKQRYIDEILMHEEEIDDDRLQKMMSRCEFSGNLCAPKESYTAERFTLFNRLNTLEFIDTENKNRSIALDDKQRNIIINLAHKNAKVTFAQVRESLEYREKLHIRFNLCSYAEKNPEYKTKLECEVKDGKLRFEDKHKVPIVNIYTGEITELGEIIKEIFRKRKETWKNAKRLYIYYSDVRKQLNLSDDVKFTALEKYYTKTGAEIRREAQAKAKRKGKNIGDFDGEASYIKQFEEKNALIELKGYHKIKNAIEKTDSNGKWEQIKEDSNKLDTIAEALTYCKSDETRTEYLRQHNITDKKIIDAALTINMKQIATYSKEALNNLLKYMDSKDRMLFNDAKEKCGYGKIKYKKQAKLEPYSGPFDKNPVVARVISQTRKLINAIVRKYNGEYPIDQIHIEVATELANSKKRKIEIAQGQKRYKEAKETAEIRCRENGLDPEEGQNLLMFRLAEEQNYFCPYTNTKITLYPTGAANEVYIKDCEIDHIIPMSRSFNDSLNNKVLCNQKANQDKKDRIPFEWFEEMYGKDSRQWAEFENRVKKMYVMPYGRRRNLIRKSWTEKDKERFLSRNLNDTRYATRHIADYLRKYFDFSKSQRDDIKDVNRIQLRSGGITAFLRYMWGLNKDREENDLHHAVDALVTACSTNGHVYLVSNLSKEIERKGKSWYKHFGWVRDRFKPWDNIRGDIQRAVKNVFVSRMPRHTVTAAAHEETIISSEETDKKRTLEVRGGFAKMGDVVRADVFVDKEGRNYVVPIYSVDIFSNKPLPAKYVPDDYSLSYEQWPSVKDDNLNFKFSIFKDDLISINGTMYYVSFFEASTVNVNVKNIDGSIFTDKKDAQDPYTKKICYRPKRKGKKCLLKKYFVDMLGSYKEIKQEKRIGNRFKGGV